jgi:hypothetical protein
LPSKRKQAWLGACVINSANSSKQDPAYLYSIKKLHRIDYFTYSRHQMKLLIPYRVWGKLNNAYPICFHSANHVDCFTAGRREYHYGWTSIFPALRSQ